MKTYKTKAFCPNCNQDQPMEFFTYQHERDSFGDCLTCNVCKENFIGSDLEEIEWDFVEETFLEKLKGLFL
jgi:hypothetical protein